MNACPIQVEAVIRHASRSLTVYIRPEVEQRYKLSAFTEKI